jgi:N-carbamoyl-L-amino-acid hydrolase
MTGSHIDTQPTGGKFDGNYGVLAGLEVVRTLNDHGIQTEARSRWPSGPTRKARASCR